MSVLFSSSFTNMAPPCVLSVCLSTVCRQLVPAQRQPRKASLSHHYIFSLLQRLRFQPRLPPACLRSIQVSSAVRGFKPFHKSPISPFLPPSRIHRTVAPTAVPQPSTDSDPGGLTPTHADSGFLVSRRWRPDSNRSIPPHTPWHPPRPLYPVPRPTGQYVKPLTAHHATPSARPVLYAPGLPPSHWSLPPIPF